MATTLGDLFKSTFNRTIILDWARSLGAVKRLRRIHPLDFCAALVGCAIGDEERSIATARRLYQRLTGYMPEESSFYDRFSDAMVVLLQRAFNDLLDRVSSVQQQAVAKFLGGTGIIDIMAADATQGILPASAAGVLPSTDDNHGGFKLTAVLSLLYQRIERIAVTDARTHDRYALQLGRWLHGLLFLFDRGYSDYGLFALIAQRGGFFVTRTKSSWRPVIAAARSGLGKRHIGKHLCRDLPFRGLVDIDARFRLRRGGSRVFRVIRVTVDGPLRRGRREPIHIWLVTNLSHDVFSAADIATLYRLRWEIEVLFRTLKSVGRLDQLRSASVPVIRSFIYATLIGMMLAHEICAQMRRARPDIEPSPYRVATLVLGTLPQILTAIGTRRYRAVVDTLNGALWREGTNPNPGRPYRISHYSRRLQRSR